MVTEQQHIPQEMIRMQHRHNRRAAENSVKSLEAEFKRTSKLDNPERWLVLQCELGEAYKEVMKYGEKVS